jgi:CheY-like chemotaxis protein
MGPSPTRGSGQPYVSSLRGVGRSRGMATSVLVIDDDPTFRKLAVRVLEGMGLSVAGEAETAEAGAAAARRLRPEAALVDVALPDGSGLALATDLAELPWRPRVVLTSSDPGALTEEVARSAGAAAFIAKQDLPDDRLRTLLTGSADRE